ncbi:hypothetical protein [Streptomyces sp. SD15]
MARHGIRGLSIRRLSVRGPILGAATAAVLAASLTGCTDDTSTPSDAASQAASAASSLASEAAEALASATAEAGRRLDEFKNGLDAKDEVRLGDRVGTDSDGRSTVDVTVTNPTSSPKTYVVQVDFRDRSGNLLDVAVVTVDDVAAGATKNATARSTHQLTGDGDGDNDGAITADVARAVRN